MIKCNQCYFTITEEAVIALIESGNREGLKKVLIQHVEGHLTLPIADLIIKNNFERIPPGKNEGSPVIL